MVVTSMGQLAHNLVMSRLIGIVLVVLVVVVTLIVIIGFVDSKYFQVS
jgi:hypothetical protein